MDYLSRTLQRSAQRQVLSAAVVSGLLGFLSLWVALTTWRERRHPDLEVSLGTLDAVLTLALAYLLSRRVRVAAWLLLGLATLGAVYAIWRGSPPVAVLPQGVSAVFLVRAIRGLGVLETTQR